MIACLRLTPTSGVPGFRHHGRSSGVDLSRRRSYVLETHAKACSFRLQAGSHDQPEHRRLPLGHGRQVSRAYGVCLSLSLSLSLCVCVCVCVCACACVPAYVLLLSTLALLLHVCEGSLLDFVSRRVCAASARLRT